MWHCIALISSLTYAPGISLIFLWHEWVNAGWFPLLFYDAISLKNILFSRCWKFPNWFEVDEFRWGYSSVAEHSTADREVPGSNPGAPLLFCNCRKLMIYIWTPNWLTLSFAPFSFICNDTLINRRFSNIWIRETGQFRIFIDFTENAILHHPVQTVVIVYVVDVDITPNKCSLKNNANANMFIAVM